MCKHEEIATLMRNGVVMVGGKLMMIKHPDLVKGAEVGMREVRVLERFFDEILMGMDEWFCAPCDEKMTDVEFVTFLFEGGIDR